MKISPKVWPVIISLATFAAGYFGYEPIQEQINPIGASDVDVEVHLPTQVEHSHKDWLPVIKAEVEKSRAQHVEIYH